MATSDKNYLIINTPKEDEPGRMVLILIRQTGGMFGGVGQTVFLIDDLLHHGEGEQSWLRGVRYITFIDELGVPGDKVEQTVVEFPAYIQYLLVGREYTRFMSADELQAQQKEDQELLKTSVESLKPAVAELPPGQYL